MLFRFVCSFDDAEFEGYVGLGGELGLLLFLGLLKDLECVLFGFLDLFYWGVHHLIVIITITVLINVN